MNRYVSKNGKEVVVNSHAKVLNMPETPGGPVVEFVIKTNRPKVVAVTQMPKDLETGKSPVQLPPSTPAAKPAAK